MHTNARHVKLSFQTKIRDSHHTFGRNFEKVDSLKKHFCANTLIKSTSTFEGNYMVKSKTYTLVKSFAFEKQKHGCSGAGILLQV